MNELPQPWIVLWGSAIRMWLFHLPDWWTYGLFPVFPLAGFMAEALYWLSLWNFKEEGCAIENG